MNRQAHDIAACLTIAEAADYAGMSVSWVRRKVRAGPLDPCVVNGRQGVTRRSVDHFLTWLRDRDAERTRREPTLQMRPQLRLVVNNS